MARDYIGVKLPPELRAELEEVCLQQGITISEYVRAAILMAMHGGFNGIDEGYKQGRALAIRMAHGMLTFAEQQMPASFEEYVARFGLEGPGAGGYPPG